MGASEKMFGWDEEWNISFAGCGFRSVYLLGASSCLLERVPRLVHGASKICGASSGCLVAAALTVGIPIEQFCVHVLSLASEARGHTLGVFHPTFSLLQRVRQCLLDRLPEDAHRRASGRLCVSLTRLRDMKNVLVSEFRSREELIQVLMCSCFFPLYCGFTPPSYRGVLYMDGALSNNLPLFEHRNTITVAPFSGESDICPSEGTFNIWEVHYGNVSIQVNTGNVHRVCTSFLPPSLETLAGICRRGYADALRFLRDKDLLETRVLMVDLVRPLRPDELESPGWREDRRVQQRITEDLPSDVQRVLCEACRNSLAEDGLWSQFTELFPVRLVLGLLIFIMLPVQLSLLLIKSVMLSGLRPLHKHVTSVLRSCRGTFRRRKRPVL